ncbi:MAG: hypothetical protein ACUVT7_05090 [Thermoplasmata archaeon]
MAEQKRMATSKVAGTWAWFFQRVSAVLLIVLLGIHIYVDHFWHVGEELTVSNINERLREALYIAIDYSLLGVVLFHGLNGARTILFDFNVFAKRQRMVDTGLWVLGIATLIWGIVILWPFIKG